jgi:predicted amidohydrolase YtcJ
MYRIMICIMLVFLMACQEKDFAELVILDAVIYTVDKNNPTAEAVAVKDGKIMEVGSAEDIRRYIGKNTEVIHAEGQFVMPGFIEGHGHFYGLGQSLINLNFLQSNSWEEIVDMVAERAKESEPGDWIIGRGWHQEKWDSIPVQNVLGYPYHYTLSDVSPENPVILFHASGHSLFANQKAMDIVGISSETPNPFGGEIVRDKQGEAVGVFEERAMYMVSMPYYEYLDELDEGKKKKKWHKTIELATDECIKKGVTSFQDAGSSFEQLSKYQRMAENGELNIRLWVMVRHSAEEMEDKLSKYKVVGAGKHFYTCRAIKSEVDGALGAFGAWLLQPYKDKPGFIGQNTTDVYEVKRIADLAMKHDMQLGVHAIGDRANRVVIDIYEGVMDQNPEKTDIRWRIEHAQHLDTTDIPRFAQRQIIASMQGIHCTSDAPFVERRLGRERAQYGSYPWRSLLDNGVIIANGTDAPVEDVDPIASFYASVTRKRIDNGFEFFPEQRMSREEAIYSYTLWNAFAAFEEDIKGSIEKGKLADLVILSRNLIECEDDEIPDTKVLYTILNGKVVHKL